MTRAQYERETRQMANQFDAQDKAMREAHPEIAKLEEDLLSAESWVIDNFGILNPLVRVLRHTSDDVYSALVAGVISDALKETAQALLETVQMMRSK